MGALALQAEPAEAGLDAARLARIDRHFERYVDDGRLAGWQLVITRGGRVAHASCRGMRDLEAGLPVGADTIWRIYSMTKPVTSVAAMTLYEEGAFELKDPVSRFVPAFGDVRVYRCGSSLKPDTEPALEPVRMWHLLTHTSGLTYGFHRAHAVDAMYRDAGFEWGMPPGMDLAGCCERWASLPLLFQPGSEWNYSVSTDVLGHVVEVLSGQTLDGFFAERIFGPLGMSDTGFVAEDSERLAVLYSPHPATGRATRNDALGAGILERPSAPSGGGGLASTAGDYLRFMRMLERGGELDDVRLLSPRTVRFMASNHLPGGADLEQYGRPLFSETTFDGVGFGLGFSVVLDPVAARYPASPGEYAWGGAASTSFWIDPREELSVLFLTQLLPSSTHPIRSQLHQLAAQAIVA